MLNKLKISRQVLRKVPHLKICQNPSEGSCTVRTDVQTDRQTWRR